MTINNHYATMQNMKLGTYQEAQEYLESFIRPSAFKKASVHEMTEDPLERMRLLLRMLSNPQEKFRSVVVSGTAGKGSTTYLISHVLTTAGYKTGLTVSPHLQKITERLQINGKEISEQAFVTLLNRIVLVIDEMRGLSVGEPTYFEILLAMAFVYFAQEKVDIAVVEVGIEGEYDGTNTLHPLVTVFTNFSLDHTEILGETVEEIATEAVRIIKAPLVNSRYAVVSGVKQNPIKRLVAKRVREKEASLSQSGEDYSYLRKSTDLSGSVFDFKNKDVTYEDIKLSLLGIYQVENASVAIEAVLQLRKFDYSVGEEHIRQSLQTAFFPGRFEIITKDTKIQRYKDIKRSKRSKESHNILISQYPNISIVLDGAHNPEKMKVFIRSVSSLFPKEQKKIFIIAFKKDKDITKMLQTILPLASQLIVTQFHTSTDMGKKVAMSTARIEHALQNYMPRKTIPYTMKNTVAEAINEAVAISQKTGALIIVTGSLYLVGEARDLLR